MHTKELVAKGGTRDLGEAYAWLQPGSQSQLPEALQMEVLAKIERLEARLAHNDREEARLRARRFADRAREHAVASDRSAASLTGLTRAPTV